MFAVLGHQEGKIARAIGVTEAGGDDGAVSVAGVDVAGVFEKVGSETEASELRTLMCRSVPVKQDGNSGFLHHKVIVVDERIVITGSMNYSTNAEENNDENVIIIDNAEIARLYLQEFDRVWNLASDPEIETIACG